MKQFKQKLILLLSASSLLVTSVLSISFNNKNHQTSNSKVSGFHITVKSSNRNLVNSIKSWNNDSQYLYNNVKSTPLNGNFDSYDQIINNDWTHSNIETNDIINDQGYSQLKSIINDNSSYFKNAQGFLTAGAFGHTFNEKSNNLILQYHQTIKESIDAGLFATIYEASNINTLMEVPYNLQPSTNFQKSNFETRAKIFPIGPFANTKDSFSNEIFVFYVHPLFKKSGLEISINNENREMKKNVKTNSNKTFDYAILNQDYSKNKPTIYNVKWNDSDGSTVLRQETLTINSSMPNIQVINEKEDKSSLIHQYFINDEKNSNLQMIAFSQIKSEAVITANVSEDKWIYQRVDDNLVPQEEKVTPISNQPLKTYQSEDHTIYLLQRIVNDKVDSSSRQYLNIYNINPLSTKFSGFTNFANSQSGIDFNQYLQETTNIDCAIDVLNPGQLRYWLLFYEHDLITHLYANVKHDEKNKNNPFALPKIKLKTTTLINNWNIIIIGSTFLLVIIAIPVVIAILRRKKIKK
ncbi:hypothetical protein [Spiroplasma endosymbiont of Aleiodes alternator]|uniref:hypothetical protein n=2 Tax=Spiroplasma TaxID=2132 RepID=UPI003CCAA6AA